MNLEACLDALAALGKESPALLTRCEAAAAVLVGAVPKPDSYPANIIEGVAHRIREERHAIARDC